MRDISATEFIDVKAPELLVFKSYGKSYSAVQVKNAGAVQSRILRWISAKLFDAIVASTRGGITVHVGELVPVHMIFDSESSVLWYEDENYSKKDKATRFIPVSADEAIHLWVKSEGMKLYEVV